MAGVEIRPPFENDPNFLKQIEDKIEPHRHFPYVRLQLLDVPLSEGVSTVQQRQSSMATRKVELESTCHICGCQLSKRSNLLRHLAGHTEVAEPFRCFPCNQSYKDWFQLKSHLLTVHPKHRSKPRPQPKDEDELKYSCHLCNLGFTSQVLMFRHLKTHTEVEKPFLCPVCNQLFDESNPFYSHLVTQHPDQYRILPKKSSWSYRSRHNRKKSCKSKITPIQVKHLSLQCTICPKRFAHQSQLDKHYIGRHQTFKSQVCKICGSKFKHAHTLQQHLMDKKCESAIEKMVSRPFNCDHCDLSLKSERGLTEHKRRFHGVRKLNGTKKNLTCLFCGYEALTPNVLLRHNRIHTGDRPFPCEACGHAFAHRSNLYAHIRKCPGAKAMGLTAEIPKWNGFSQDPNKPKRLAGEEVFKCSKCSLTYREFSKLKVHEGSHGDKYPCPLCPCAFNHFTGLSCHKRRLHPTEAEIKTFKCTDCGKVLKTHKGLLYHQNIHELNSAKVSGDIQPHFQEAEVLIPVAHPLHREIQTTKRPMIPLVSVAEPEGDPLATPIIRISDPSTAPPRDVTDLTYQLEDPTSSWVNSIAMDSLAVVSEEVAVLPTTFPITVLKMETS